ncbi:MAG: GAF domain-containing protein [Elusimicrobia bacterium]|nr:GAF domain-containing protein [Elusimicrobiota bacterium]
MRTAAGLEKSGMMDRPETDDGIQKRLEERDALLKRPSRARYDKVHARLEQKWRRRELKAERMMREVVDELWDHFADNPYSWCGFYVLSPSGQDLMLGPHRDKPACSPLSLQGACGRALREGKPVVFPDVKALSEGYIECHPDTASEIALPVFDAHGKVWAVFDVDSRNKSAFDDMDQRWLERILKHFQSLAKSEPGGLR